MTSFGNIVLAVALLAAANPALARGTTGAAGTSSGTGVSANSGTFDTSWDAQNSYWRNQYPARSYYNSGRGYTAYEPAYRYGVDLYNSNPGKPYDQLDQSQLNRGWTTARGNSNLNWDDAQMATRDAYNRMYENRTQ